MTAAETGRQGVAARAAVAVPVAFAAACVAFVTRDGILYDPDSEGYLRAARRIAADPASAFAAIDTSDLTSVAVHPPGYSALLAGLGRIVGEQPAARVIAVAATAITVGAVATLVRAHAGPAAAFLAAATLVVSRGFVFRLGGFMMSDGLYLALAATTLCLLDRWLRTWRDLPVGRHRALLAALTVSAGAAALTRIGGVAVIATVAYGLSVSTAPRAGRRALFVTMAAASPFAAWAAVQLLDDRNGRTIGWYPPRSDEPVAAGRDLVRMLITERVAVSAIGTAAAVVVVVAAIVAVPVAIASAARTARRSSRTDDDLAVATLAVFAIGSIAVVIAARLVLDPFVSVADRHLMASWMAVVMVVAIRWRRWTQRWPRRAATVGTVLVTLLVASAATTTVRSLIAPGAAWGNLALHMEDSALLDEIRRLPAGVTLYSNRIDYVYLLADRDVRPVAIRTDPTTGRPNPRYRAQIDDMVRALRRGDGYVVLFDIDDPLWTDAPEDFERAAGLTVAERVEDGWILVCGARCGR